jgi:hypothetical protein
MVAVDSELIPDVRLQNITKVMRSLGKILLSGTFIWNIHNQTNIW